MEDYALQEERGPAHDPNEDRELRDLLSKALKHLSTDQRVVIELVYGVGNSLAEVAAITQAPVGTVKARLFRARVKLRNALPALLGDVSEQREDMP
jgi:RNA polymerase sigma-70 factor (ECF subfamily)